MIIVNRVVTFVISSCHIKMLASSKASNIKYGIAESMKVLDLILSRLKLLNLSKIKKKSILLKTNYYFVLKIANLAIERPRKVHFSSKNILKHILIDLIKENILIDRMDTTIKLSFNKEDLKKNLK